MQITIHQIFSSSITRKQAEAALIFHYPASTTGAQKQRHEPAKPLVCLHAGYPDTLKEVEGWEL